MKNLPERIYLNIGDEVSADVDFRELSEVTWSEEKVFDNDIAFTRKPQWISVEEELPEDDRLVLAHFSDVDPELSYATAYYRDGAWQTPDDWYYDCKIDFWKPIMPPSLHDTNTEKR